MALEDGETVTRELVARVFDEEMARIAEEVRAATPDEAAARELVAAFEQAKTDARDLFTAEEFRPFLALRSELAPVTN